MAKTPFDQSLVDADANKKCPNVAEVLKALPALHRVEYTARVPKRNFEDGFAVGTMPRLFFSCTLEETYAICPDR